MEASDQFESQVTFRSVGCDNATPSGHECQTQSTPDEIMETYENQIQDERCNHSTNKSEVMNSEKSDHEKTFLKNWSLCHVDTDMMRVIRSVVEQLKSVTTVNNTADETHYSETIRRDGIKIGKCGHENCKNITTDEASNSKRTVRDEGKTVFFFLER